MPPCEVWVTGHRDNCPVRFHRNALCSLVVRASVCSFNSVWVWLPVPITRLEDVGYRMPWDTLKDLMKRTIPLVCLRDSTQIIPEMKYSFDLGDMMFCIR